MGGALIVVKESNFNPSLYSGDTHLIERHEDQELPESQLQIERRRVTDASPNAPAHDLTETTRRVNMDLDREPLQKPALQLPLIHGRRKFRSKIYPASQILPYDPFLIVKSSIL